MSDQELMPQPSAQARQWAMFCHYSAFFWFLVPMIGNVLGPLIVWQLKKDMDPVVDEQGKEALNFQIFRLQASVEAGCAFSRRHWAACRLPPPP